MTNEQYPYLLVPLVIAFFLFLAYKYKLNRGKQLSVFAKHHNFQVLTIENIPFEAQSLEEFNQYAQKKLGEMISQDFNPEWLKASRYFESIHLESVLTRHEKHQQICLLEVHATFDFKGELPDIRPEHRFDSWDGNILLLRCHQKKFDKTSISLGDWRLFFYQDRVLIFRFDNLKLKALWPMGKLKALINEALSLAESRYGEASAPQ
ncbi:hypothetical protein [Planctobacterium marinum]